MAQKDRYPLMVILLLCLLLGLSNPSMSHAQQLSARAAVERTQVFVGESFILQINIKGDDRPGEPDVSKLSGFRVESLGGQQNSSTAVTIINGRVTKNVRQAYLYNYRLTPEHPGRLTIPSIQIPAGGAVLSTQPIAITVRQPTQSKDFKLQMKLSSAEVYLGQPLTLTVTWYISRDVQGFQFNLPVLNDPRFDVADVELPIDHSQRSRYLRIPLPSGDLVAVKGRQRFKGKDFITVTFKKILIPRISGTFPLPQSTVACNAVSGYQARRRFQDPLFDRFFNDDFFSGRGGQANYKKYVVPSNKPEITVRELPSTGRPPEFNGLVGQYSISAAATPTKVRVGDPITLTLKVTGPEFLENVELPVLHLQSRLSTNFKIPEDMSPGTIHGRTKTFTQTLRARHSDVTEIPPISLPYFDALQGRYTTTQSDAISLQVEATKVVTADDAEGKMVDPQSRSDLESLTVGIMHNYEDLDALNDQSFGRESSLTSPLWLAILLFPPAVFLLLLFGSTMAIKRNKNPQAIQSRKAYGILENSLNHLSKELDRNPEQVFFRVFEAFKTYLGSKLGLQSGALTFSDVRGLLLEKGVKHTTVDELKKLFSDCEAMRYTQSTGNIDDSALMLSRTISLAKKLKGDLK